jgi:NAD(P)-dependent dehydrogenase (short-subunit alcohol dehydrogenase family)
MFDNLFSLKGRVALVSGGSRGIGKMIAAGFLGHGASRVYITARKAAACEEAARELAANHGGECIALPVDISISPVLRCWRMRSRRASAVPTIYARPHA